jgi:acyl transferase domain-containing protein/acyl carrier protein
MAQPALFVVEYAMARLWMSWGIRPDALIGHSLGEYVAACLAGVWSLEDALALVALRARLMQRQPTGAMLAISLSETEVRALLTPRLSLAAVNGQKLCVVSGPHEAIAALAEELTRRNIGCQVLQTSHAFHSAMMEPVAEPLLARLSAIKCHPPTIRFVSNVTGTWIEPTQATDPRYWAEHLLGTVRFADGLDTLLQQSDRCLVEVGPGNTLATLALRRTRQGATQTIVTSMRHPNQLGSDSAHLMQAAGRIWLAGAPIDWPAFYAGQQRRRLHLPTYPFQRQRYWIDPPQGAAIPAGPVAGKRPGGEWCYLPSWQRTSPPEGEATAGTQWLLLMDTCGIGEALTARLLERGVKVSRVHAGPRFGRRGPGEFEIDPGSAGDFGLLAADLRQSGDLPDVVVHLWNVSAEAAARSSAAARDRSLHSLVFLAQSLGIREMARRCHIAVVSNGLHDVTGEERLDPIKALLLGPVGVIPQEYAHLSCDSIDLDFSPRWRDQQIDSLLADATGHRGGTLIAHRGAHRWRQVFEPVPMSTKAGPVRAGGRYLITGGTGGVGLALAEWLAQAAPGVKLALVSRSAGDAGEPTAVSQAATGADVVQSAIRRLAELGADVITLQADVTDQAQMQRAVDQMRQKFGAIDGVVHAAGIAGGGTIEMKARKDAEIELAAKVDGCLVLEAVLGDTPLDFFVLCSSLTAMVGGLGQVAYTAANAFLDAFAQSSRVSHRAWRKVVAINWDRWQNIGMAAAAEARQREFADQEAGEGMSRAEGMEIFGRILVSRAVPRIVVSTRDLPPLVEQSRAYQLDLIESRGQRLAVHPRPPLAGEYVAPEDATERAIAEIWQEQLGIGRVGRNDDFFALGGDSLIAIKLMSRLRDVLQVPLAVRTLYQTPTVSALAELVASVRWVIEGRESLQPAQDDEEGVL